MVGIKGSGMTALAELLKHMGAVPQGSDTHETFYTDAILNELRIPIIEGFNKNNLPSDCDLVVYSAAYDPLTHPELLASAERDLPMLTYPEALGALSRRIPSVGISGVHGKTTTTAMAGELIRLGKLPGTVLVGSASLGFGGRQVYTGGERFLVAETCEYRRHFLTFTPTVLVLTGIEADHLDYYRDYDDICSAFLEYSERIATGGSLIYCADNAGACEVAAAIATQRPDVRRIPYGHTAQGGFRIHEVSYEAGKQVFRLEGVAEPFELPVPGRHNQLNAAAALAAVDELCRAVDLPALSSEVATAALAGFRGTKRRAELRGEHRGVMFMDDYGHHPTAIAGTLEGLRDFFPGRRLVVDFMSHTYSRTEALLEEFAKCFAEADLVILHKIYASAREQYNGSVDGHTLFRAVSARHAAVQYFEEPLDAVPYLREVLQPGDLFVTLGAGDNWRIIDTLLELPEFSSLGAP